MFSYTSIKCYVVNVYLFVTRTKGFFYVVQVILNMDKDEIKLILVTGFTGSLNFLQFNGM